MQKKARELLYNIDTYDGYIDDMEEFESHYATYIGGERVVSIEFDNHVVTLRVGDTQKILELIIDYYKGKQLKLFEELEQI